MDAAILSAFAAAAAAGAATTVAGIQLYVGYRQSKAELVSAQAAMMMAESAGRHATAAFRQKWIECVRDTLCEYHSIFMAADNAEKVSMEDRRKLAALKTKLKLLLNPNEKDSQELLKQLASLDLLDDVTARAGKDEALSALAQRVLKVEWVRIKDELRDRKPG